MSYSTKLPHQSCSKRKQLGVLLNKQNVLLNKHQKHEKSKLKVAITRLKKVQRPSQQEQVSAQASRFPNSKYLDYFRAQNFVLWNGILRVFVESGNFVFNPSGFFRFSRGSKPFRRLVNQPVNISFLTKNVVSGDT